MVLHVKKERGEENGGGERWEKEKEKDVVFIHTAFVGDQVWDKRKPPHSENNTADH
jgi:hypothetical protein